MWASLRVYRGKDICMQQFVYMSAGVRSSYLLSKFEVASAACTKHLCPSAWLQTGMLAPGHVIQVALGGWAQRMDALTQRLHGVNMAEARMQCFSTLLSFRKKL